MRADAFNDNILLPAATLLERVWPGHDTADVRRLLLAVAGQESVWQARRQSGGGPARGFWQCEETGAVTAVLTGPDQRVPRVMADVCEALAIRGVSSYVWGAIEYNDALAYAVARLFLWMDPHPVPTTREGSWDCYLRTWRPGTPRPTDWPNNWSAALTVYPLETT